MLSQIQARTVQVNKNRFQHKALNAAEGEIDKTILSMEEGY
jgi:hypothetical protein